MDLTSILISSFSLEINFSLQSLKHLIQNGVQRHRFRLLQLQSLPRCSNNIHPPLLFPDSLPRLPTHPQRNLVLHTLPHRLYMFVFFLFLPSFSFPLTMEYPTNHRS
jgi:hypothetical protein